MDIRDYLDEISSYFAPEEAWNQVSSMWDKGNNAARQIMEEGNLFEPTADMFSPQEAMAQEPTRPGATGSWTEDILPQQAPRANMGDVTTDISRMVQEALGSNGVMTMRGNTPSVSDNKGFGFSRAAPGTSDRAFKNYTTKAQQRQIDEKELVNADKAALNASAYGENRSRVNTEAKDQVSQFTASLEALGLGELTPAEEADIKAQYTRQELGPIEKILGMSGQNASTQLPSSSFDEFIKNRKVAPETPGWIERNSDWLEPTGGAAVALALLLGTQGKGGAFGKALGGLGKAGKAVKNRAAENLGIKKLMGKIGNKATKKMPDALIAKIEQLKVQGETDKRIREFIKRNGF